MAEHTVPPPSVAPIRRLSMTCKGCTQTYAIASPDKDAVRMLRDLETAHDLLNPDCAMTGHWHEDCS